MSKWLELQLEEEEEELLKPLVLKGPSVLKLWLQEEELLNQTHSQSRKVLLLLLPHLQSKHAWWLLPCSWDPKAWNLFLQRRDGVSEEREREKKLGVNGVISSLSEKTVNLIWSTFKLVITKMLQLCFSESSWGVCTVQKGRQKKYNFKTLIKNTCHLGVLSERERELLKFRVITSMGVLGSNKWS